MTQHMHSYSGQSYDRWVERNSNSSTLGKVQKQFWFTKSAVIRKFGKKEDEHVVASDAELDAKKELFKAIESSTKDLQVLLADYQNKICVMAQEENALGRLLKEYGKQDKTRAGKMMTAVGKSLSYTAQQRVALRNPLVRLFQEVDTFHTRAVEDTACTVAEMEKIRTEYRGALMWMKNISQDFNPDQYHQLEKFREVQGTVKQKKAKFDRIKLKSLQKIDLLAASRCNMFSHALIVYQNNLITFSDKTSKTMNTVANNFKGYHPYDFQVIKELAEPPAKLSDDTKEEEEDDVDKLEADDETFFHAEYHDDPETNNIRSQEKQSTKITKNLSNDLNKSDSMVNLLDCSDENKSEVLASLHEAENKPATHQDNCEQSSQIMDFLTNNPEVPDTEKDTQQMLKELFDSPVHQPLPVFGSELSECTSPVSAMANSSIISHGLEDLDTDSFSMLQNQSNQQPQNMFLPSQLLDFGMKSWKPQTVQQATAPTLQPQTLNSSSNKTLPANSWMQQKRSPTGTSNLSNQNLKQEVQKLDWYKVFQDIDPLGDPASAIFNQVTEDDKKC
ncbi:islet cell autoantigen 1 [Procambarus clarkii]|uniref:islet cell autoantigen 1 n=1 Tax=Procambarus clarkii TaxID=6728 RepID=UPI001E671EAD|nr:islet cell autoantigen 1-like [Procambarus clarkii]XP_045603861.1 islet cell autoantigen 1-like [Procambarus clarkii]XP_045603862.1 islet cell autoantigen 1-like [Procambarus clarkii]XP_045603863.1 islet cell autoantigen 1-like [Procambarus clarkii]